MVGEIGNLVGIEIALVRSIIINPIVQRPPLFIGQFYVGMSFFKDTDQFTGVCMIFVRLQNSHVGFRALAVHIRVQIQIRRAVAVFIFLSGTKVECFFTVVAGDTGTVEDRLYFQVESERANATFGCFDGMSGTLRSNHAFGYGDLVLVFVASDTGYDLTRLSGQPATHPLDGGTVFVDRLYGYRRIGRYLENHRTVFFHGHGSQLALDIPSALNPVPVVVGYGFQIGVFVGMQTEFFHGSARYVTQAFSFVNVLDKYGCFLFIQFHTIRNGGRSNIFTYDDRADKAFTFLFHQASHIVEHIYQIDAP